MIFTALGSAAFVRCKCFILKFSSKTNTGIVLTLPLFIMVDEKKKKLRVFSFAEKKTLGGQEAFFCFFSHSKDEKQH